MAKKMKHLFFFGITSILLILAALFYRQSFLVMLFLTMCAVVAVSYYLTKYAFFKLHPEIFSTSYEAEKDLTIPLTISLKNDSLIPLLHVEVSFLLSSPYYEKGCPITCILPASAKKETVITYPVIYDFCGMYEAAITSMVVYDFFHLFRFEKKESIKKYINVFPTSTTQIHYHPDLYSEGFDEYEASNQKGNVSSNVTDLRQYQPGDKLQKIHWKLSAKINKLMVKENESTSTHQFFLLMELYGEKEHPQYLDQMIENTYAVAVELLAHNELCLLGFYRESIGEFITYPLRGEDDITLALCDAFFEIPYTAPSYASDIYKNSSLKFGTLLQITHKGVFDENLEQITE